MYTTLISSSFFILSSVWYDDEFDEANKKFSLQNIDY